MLSLFRINDPYRLVILFILLLIFRISLLWVGVDITMPEVQWMLIGEKLANDGGIMYQDLWDTTGPLAVLVYRLLALLFDNSIWSYHALSLIVLFVQAAIFNHLLLSNKAYKENTFVPGFVYIILAHFFQELMILSPPSMGLTFVLLSINNIFKRIDNQTRDDLFLYTGISLGVASLFYLPYFIFFVIAVLSLVLFSGAILRRILLLIHGYFMVMVLSGLYAYLYDAQYDWWDFYVASWWQLDQLDFISSESLMWCVLVPTLVLLIGIFKTYSLGRFVNHQVKFQQVMLFLMVGGIFNLFTADHWSLYQLILLLPPMAFFVSHYLLLIRKMWQSELITLLIVLSVFGTHLTLAYNWFFVHELISLNRMEATFPEESEVIVDKKVLVLGPDSRYYCGNKLASPFLNWQLSERVFKGLNYYLRIEQAHRGLINDLPDVIVDLENIVPLLFERLPLVERNYVRSQSEPKYYLKID
ncbi:MAG: DUF6427 family protein [Bacteroidota bacterium]